MTPSDVAAEVEFRQLFERAYRPLLGYALRRSSDAASAEDIVVETFIVVWRRRNEVAMKEISVAWLYGIARRLLANQRRGERRRLSGMQFPSPAHIQADPIDAYETTAMTRAVVAATARLPETDQEILRLAVWEGLSHREIAIALGCTENAAANRLHRARQRLHNELVTEGLLHGHDVIEVRR